VRLTDMRTEILYKGKSNPPVLWDRSHAIGSFRIERHRAAHWQYLDLHAWTLHLLPPCTTSAVEPAGPEGRDHQSALA
jgi:hypothetical protein